MRGGLSVPVIVLSARTDSPDKVERWMPCRRDVTEPLGMDAFWPAACCVRRNADASETDQPGYRTRCVHSRSGGSR